MKKIILSISFLFFVFSSIAQHDNIVELTPGEAERIFLQQNLELIAEKLNISIADAAITQAKLWDNPEFSVSDINVWHNEDKQFSVELSQLIQTAGKRGKLVNMERAAKEIALAQFKELLRNLKIELRLCVYEMIYLDSYRNVLESQLISLQKLISASEKQVHSGNLSKGELLRLQSELFELENEYNELLISWNSQQKSIKSLLGIDVFSTVKIVNNNLVRSAPESISIISLLDAVSDIRPDIKIHQLQKQYFDRSLQYEKSLRVPDFTISGGYDRFGGVWDNFWGVGISFDLPVFNRNQGNIKIAKISSEQSGYLTQLQQQKAHHEIVESYENYKVSYNFHKKIGGNSLLNELEEMMEIYTRNFLNHNIGIVEYLDFMDAYKKNKETQLSAEKNLCVQFEELQYVVGKDLNN